MLPIRLYPFESTGPGAVGTIWMAATAALVTKGIAAIAIGSVARPYRPRDLVPRRRGDDLRGDGMHCRRGRNARLPHAMNAPYRRAVK